MNLYFCSISCTEVKPPHQLALTVVVRAAPSQRRSPETRVRQASETYSDMRNERALCRPGCCLCVRVFRVPPSPPRSYNKETKGRKRVSHSHEQRGGRVLAGAPFRVKLTMRGPPSGTLYVCRLDEEGSAVAVAVLDLKVGGLVVSSTKPGSWGGVIPTTIKLLQIDTKGSRFPSICPRQASFTVWHTDWHVWSLVSRDDAQAQAS